MPFCPTKKQQKVRDLLQKPGKRTSPFWRPFPLKWPSSLVQWWQRSVIWSQKIPCPKLKPGRKNRQMGRIRWIQLPGELPESLKQPYKVQYLHFMPAIFANQKDVTHTKNGILELWKPKKETTNRRTGGTQFKKKQQTKHVVYFLKK